MFYKKLMFAILVSFFSATRLFAFTYSVTDLGSLGFGESFATGINSGGQVVGLSKVDSEIYHPFFFSDQSLIDIGSLSLWSTRANGINDSGQIVGNFDYVHDPIKSHAFLYSDGVSFDLGTLGGDSSIGNAINNQGEVVGLSDTANNTPHAFVYSMGVMHDLGSFLGNEYSNATSINDSGNVVGYYSLNGINRHPFSLIDGQIQLLQPISGAAFDINISNEIVGCIDTGDEFQAFAFIDERLHELGTLGGTSSIAHAINSNGIIVGWAEGYEDVSKAFIFVDGTMHDLNDLIDPNSEIELLEARDINDNGQIVGYGVNRQGSRRAFLLTPNIPEPTIIALALVSLPVLLRQKRHQI